MGDIVDWRGPFTALEDSEVFHAIMDSDHPACRWFTRWMCHDLAPALDLFGLRGEPGTGRYI